MTYFYLYDKIILVKQMKTRSELRNIAMTILYQIEIYNKNSISYDVEEIINENLEIDNDFVKELVYGVITHKNDIDKLANKYLDEWKIDRFDTTGASVLRIGVYELKYSDTPKIVVINEAIELSKKYSDENVTKMINAVLDRISKE